MQMAYENNLTVNYKFMVNCILRDFSRCHLLPPLFFLT